MESLGILYAGYPLLRKFREALIYSPPKCPKNQSGIFRTKEKCPRRSVEYYLIIRKQQRQLISPRRLKAITHYVKYYMYCRSTVNRSAKKQMGIIFYNCVMWAGAQFWNNITRGHFTGIRFIKFRMLLLFSYILRLLVWEK